MSSFSLAALERKKEEINHLSYEISRLYLNDIRLSNDFNYSEGERANEYINSFKSGRMSFSDANDKLHAQYNNLSSRYLELMSGSAKIYAIIEREKDKRSVTNIILKQVGFVSGGLQAVGGYGICKVSVGSACAYLGAPLFLHGLENLWENGYYLALRKEPNDTPLRKAYRESAKLLGGNDNGGDIAYSVGDLSLSAGTVFKYGLREDAWKLFYYIKEDYIIGWKTMGAAGLTSELVGDSAVGFSLYKLINSNSTNWEDLSATK
jgi:hypothetical protein